MSAISGPFQSCLISSAFHPLAEIQAQYVRLAKKSSRNSKPLETTAIDPKPTHTINVIDTGVPTRQLIASLIPVGWIFPVHHS